MTAKALLPVLTVVLMAAGLAGQEKQPSKAGAAAQSPHTYNITPGEKDRTNPVRLTDASVERGKKIFASSARPVTAIRATARANSLLK